MRKVKSDPYNTDGKTRRVIKVTILPKKFMRLRLTSSEKLNAMPGIGEGEKYESE
jgi:hypothetical protein